MLLPVFPVLAVLFVARRPQAGPFGAGFFLGIGTGLAAALVLARPYLATVSAQLHLIGLCAAGFGVATALPAPLAFPGARSRVRRVCAFRRALPWFKGEKVVLPSLGGMPPGWPSPLPVVVLVGLAERPYLQIVRGQTDPAMIRRSRRCSGLSGCRSTGCASTTSQASTGSSGTSGCPRCCSPARARRARATVGARCYRRRVRFLRPLRRCGCGGCRS